MPHRPLRLLLAFGAAASVAWCGAVRAEPEPGAAGGDAVLQLLRDKGLVPKDLHATGTSLAVQVRDAASDLVLAAMNFLGVPYRRGGSDAEAGFDCSGFTRHIFQTSAGLALPRSVDAQAAAPGLAAVERSALAPGDLVFFNTLRRTFSHVGIYVGEGRFIHAPRPGGAVRIEDMHKRYWDRRFTGARRIQSAAPLVER